MKQFIVGLVGSFAVLLGVAYYLNSKDNNFDFITLLFANALLAVVFFLSFQINYKGLQKTHGEASYRAKITSTMLKFFVIIGAMLLYIVTKDKGTIHKPTIYYFGAAYIVYMIIETVFLSHLAKKSKA